MFQVRFIDDGLRNTRVFENVLSETDVHLEDIVRGLGFGCGGVGAAVNSAIALFVESFGHVGMELGVLHRCFVPPRYWVTFLYGRDRTCVLSLK